MCVSPTFRRHFQVSHDGYLLKATRWKCKLVLCAHLSFEYWDFYLKCGCSLNICMNWPLFSALFAAFWHNLMNGQLLIVFTAIKYLDVLWSQKITKETLLKRDLSLHLQKTSSALKSDFIPTAKLWWMRLVSQYVMCWLAWVKKSSFRALLFLWPTCKPFLFLPIIKRL